MRKPLVQHDMGQLHIRAGKLRRVPMRIFDGIIRIRFVAFVLLGCLPATSVLAFDVTKPAGEEAATPMEAFRLGFQAYRAGDKETAVDALQFAASQGSAMAQWKLGRMYAAGDGVEVSPLRAFEYFSDIANAHAEDSPNSPEAPFVANAFVELGGFCSRKCIWKARAVRRMHVRPRGG